MTHFSLISTWVRRQCSEQNYHMSGDIGCRQVFRRSKCQGCVCVCVGVKCPCAESNREPRVKTLHHPLSLLMCPTQTGAAKKHIRRCANQPAEWQANHLCMSIHTNIVLSSSAEAELKSLNDQLVWVIRNHRKHKLKPSKSYILVGVICKVQLT